MFKADIMKSAVQQSKLEKVTINASLPLKAGCDFTYCHSSDVAYPLFISHISLFLQISPTTLSEMSGPNCIRFQEDTELSLELNKFVVDFRQIYALWVFWYCAPFRHDPHVWRTDRRTDSLIANAALHYVARPKSLKHYRPVSCIHEMPAAALHSPSSTHDKECWTHSCGLQGCNDMPTVPLLQHTTQLHAYYFSIINARNTWVQLHERCSEVKT